MPNKSLWKLNPVYQNAIPEQHKALRRQYVNCCLENVGLMAGISVECEGKLFHYD